MENWLKNFVSINTESNRKITDTWLIVATYFLESYKKQKIININERDKHEWDSIKFVWTRPSTISCTNSLGDK